MSEIRQAVILGAGERKCFDKPVGFLDLEDTSIIERLITILNANGIDKITVVTGFKREYYEELSKKKNLNLVFNEKYKWTGTMHSLALAKESVEGDFLLIESDMVFEERAVSTILENENSNCMVVTSESGSGDEAFVEIRNSHIFRISKDIHQLNKVDGEFIGLSKISFQAYSKMLQDFEGNRNPYLNYEYVLLNITDEFNIGYVKIDDLVWSELDNFEHYKNLIYTIYPKLQRKEMEIRKQYVKNLLSETLDIDPVRIGKIEKLGGLTNKNYKVVMDDKEYVARVPGNGTSKFIDRLNEKINSSIAYELGIDSETIFFDENTGFKITKFIDNAETLNPATGKREDNMELMAGVLRTLHDSKRTFKDTFDPFKGTEFYEDALISANGKVFGDYYEMKKIFMPLNGVLEELGMDYAPSHLDTLPENFIKSGDSKMYLIDWEYSGNYDSLYDLAAVSLECSFSEDEEDLFLRKYFGKEPTKVERLKIHIHKIMQDMFWSMWAAAKAAKGDDYLFDYAFDRYNRGKGNITKYLEMKEA